jgi:hypothetical protein
MIPNLIHSILAIKSDAQVSVNAEDIDQIIWHDGNPTNITNEQILAKQVELKATHTANQYQRDREFKYPSWQDQLDMQYHDKVDGTTTWEDAIQAIKDANPKP